VIIKSRLRKKAKRMLMRVYFFLNRRLNAQTRRKGKNMAARLEGGIAMAQAYIVSLKGSPATKRNGVRAREEAALF
jgi:hypothetical protein